MVTSARPQQDTGRSRLSRSAVLALIALTLAIHNAEEYIAFPMFLKSLGRQLSGWLPAPALQHSTTNLHIALILATVLPGIFIVWAIFARRQWLLIAALLVEAVLLVNAFAHMLAALLRGGYVPGLVTAILINLPFGIYVFRKAVRDSWIPRSRVWQLIGVAILLHIIWLSSGVLRAKRTADSAVSSVGCSRQSATQSNVDWWREGGLHVQGLS